MSRIVDSFDDFYTIADTNLTVIETSLDNLNLAIWDKVKPDVGLPQWIRTLVANRLASSGKEWTQIVSVTTILLFLRYL